ncbi:YolD-like family protein [Brevibacillus migulae]|uniref:YolD-like family protein n=1 Tax=Brevibacillus migulae TaxID=1644114 RepID=UPI00106E664C|nr:YolD-like family protein [Brevibacillus migulae]
MRNRTVSKKQNLFAASRFVLPEHRELYLQIQEEQRRYVPPELDEQQQAEISEQLWTAYQEREQLRLTYYDGTFARERRGIILHVDQGTRRLKLQTDEETIWIRFSAVLGARVE